MTDPAAARSFLAGEVEALEAFDYGVVAPAGHPLHAVEVRRTEGAQLAVHVPGRPPVVPELSLEVQGALRKRGFTVEDEADRTRPWVRVVADAAAAVELLFALQVEVFEEFREEELRFAIRIVASTADGWDDRLKQMFGGATHQEVLAGRASESAPTTKPGQGTGQYL